MPRPPILCKDSVDDPSILDEHLLVHAVHPGHWVKIIGGAGYRPNSVSFRESNDGTGNSSNLWEVLKELDLPKTFMPPPEERWKDHGFVEFPAGLPREFGAKVVRMPLDENEAHAGVCTLTDDAKNALTRRSTVLSLGNPQLKK